MRAVARAAGTGMAALYEIAETKDRLLVAILQPDIEARADQVAAASRRAVSARDRLYACLEALIGFDLERPDFARIVRVNAPSGLFRQANLSEKVEIEISHIVRRGVRDGSIRTDISADQLTCLISAHIDGALTRWALDDADTQSAADRSDGCTQTRIETRTNALWAMIWPAICAG